MTAAARAKTRLTRALPRSRRKTQDVDLLLPATQACRDAVQAAAAALRAGVLTPAALAKAFAEDRPRRQPLRTASVTVPAGAGYRNALRLLAQMMRERTTTAQRIAQALPVRAACPLDPKAPRANIAGARKGAADLLLSGFAASPRLLNLCLDHGLATVGALARMTRDDFASLPGVGAHLALEASSVLRRAGAAFRGAALGKATRALQARHDALLRTVLRHGAVEISEEGDLGPFSRPDALELLRHSEDLRWLDADRRFVGSRRKETHLDTLVRRLLSVCGPLSTRDLHEATARGDGACRLASEAIAAALDAASYLERRGGVWHLKDGEGAKSLGGIDDRCVELFQEAGGALGAEDFLARAAATGISPAAALHFLRGAYVAPRASAVYALFGRALQPGEAERLAGARTGDVVCGAEWRPDGGLRAESRLTIDNLARGRVRLPKGHLLDADATTVVLPDGERRNAFVRDGRRIGNLGGVFTRLAARPGDWLQLDFAADGRTADARIVPQPTIDVRTESGRKRSS